MSSQKKPILREVLPEVQAPAPASNGSGKIALCSYGVLSGAKGPDGPHVNVRPSAFKPLLASILEHVKVDEAWYVGFYPDVGKAISRGDVASAKQHYVKHGYFEDRMPRPIEVETKWYLERYPDVARAVKEGKFKSAQEHFDRFGFRNGRVPYAGWSLCD